MLFRSPNRILTFQWADMIGYKSGGASPGYKFDSDYDFQVKIYENSGVIEFIYGNMTVGSDDISYTCGINAPTQTGIATSAELLCQQSVNTSIFNNIEENDLATRPESNSKITFSPNNIETAPSGISFSNVSPTSMDISWTDNAATELGYAIYGSIDGGSSYDFLTTVSSGSGTITETVTGLNPCTVYDFKVYAFTEFLSIPLSGQQSTSSAISCSGNFSPTNGNLGCDMQTVLSWNSVSCAESYKVYFEKDVNPPTILVSNQTDNSYSTGMLDASGTYYWKIVPTNTADGDATGCSVQNFTTDATSITPPTAADVERCGIGSVTLNASGGEYDPNYLWYDSEFGGNFLGSGPSFSTSNIEVTTPYYVMSNNVEPEQNVVTTVTADNGCAGPGALVFDVSNLNKIGRAHV